MQLKSLRVCCKAVLIAIIGLFCADVIAAFGVHDSKFATLVSRLYERYSWVAVFSVSPPAGAVPLSQASQGKLLEDFVPDLARAIRSDAQCAERRREICILDFDLLFDSQDPSANDLMIHAGPHDTEAKACFKEADGAHKCLSFIGSNIDGSIRITDIVYPDGRSLRQLLGLPKK